MLKGVPVAAGGADVGALQVGIHAEKGRTQVPQLRGDDLQLHRSLLERGKGNAQPEEEQGEGAQPGDLRSGQVPGSAQQDQGKRAHGHAGLSHAEGERQKQGRRDEKDQPAPVHAPGRLGNLLSGVVQHEGDDGDHQPAVFVIRLLVPGGNEPLDAAFIPGRAEFGKRQVGYRQQDGAHGQGGNHGDG